MIDLPLPHAPNSEVTLGQIAAENPAAISTFERLGLDYCCGGKRTLAQACAAAGLEPDTVLEAIRKGAPAAQGAQGKNWLGASMTELADHIESTHHAFVRDAITRLGNIVPRVVKAHSGKDPRLVQLAETIAKFSGDMNDHMVREERVLFPWLRRLENRSAVHTGPPWSVRRPISCLVHDHDDAGRDLAAMRFLTDGFTAPAGACVTYRSMLDLLRALEADTHVHVHKENNILFPAGIAAEEKLDTAVDAPESGEIGRCAVH